MILLQQDAFVAVGCLPLDSRIPEMTADAGWQVYFKKLAFLGECGLFQSQTGSFQIAKDQEDFRGERLFGGG